MKTGIYKITCLSNFKCYIGSSKNIAVRWKNHKKSLNDNKHKNSYLQNCWNKYGEKSFIFEIIEECNVNCLLIREQYWLDFTECYIKEKGFNVCKKSNSPLGYKHTLENKIKMSNIKKEQLKLNLIQSNLKRREKGFKHSEETKLKISESKIGERNPMFGTKLSEEQKKIKVKNLNSVPRWNKGLTKENDERIKKLSVWKNKLPPNAIKHKLINLFTNETWESDSLKGLSLISPLSLATLARLKRKVCGEKITKNYKIIW